MSGRPVQSLLEVMDAITGGLTDGLAIKFDPPRVTVEFSAADLR